MRILFLMRFKDHPMLYILVPLGVIAISFSFYRFMVAGTYIVEYEGDCDPATQSCFFACEDEECSSVYYHSWMQKNNADLFTQCGPDITDCEAAFTCLSTDRHCTIEYCDSSTDECVGPTGGSNESEESDL